MTQARPAVFVGSSTEGLSVAKAIQVELDHTCEVTLWSQGVFGLGEGSLESLVARLKDFDFAVLVLTPDDMTESRGERQQSPRDNVLLELGLFLGRLGRRRTFIVYDRAANIRLPSDLAGVTAATYQPHSSGEWQPSVGAACTRIEAAIKKHGPRIKGRRSVLVHAADTDDSHLSGAEQEYLMTISRPRNRGAISLSWFDGNATREDTAYLEMLEKFVELGLMRQDGDSVRMTSAGWRVADQLWELTILRAIERNSMASDVVPYDVIIKETVLTDGPQEFEEFERHLASLKERGDVTTYHSSDGHRATITPQGKTRALHGV